MTVLAGAKVDTADFTPGVGVGISAYVFKGTSESVTSNVTLQNDDALTFTMLPGITYEVELFLSVSGNTAGDFKSAWSVPADATGGLKAAIGPGDTAFAQSGTTPFAVTQGWASRSNTAGRFSQHGYTTALIYQIESNGSFIWERGIITSATGGTFVLQWAQNTSNATATVISGASYLKYTRVA